MDMTPIPLFRPSTTRAERDTVLEVLDSGWWGKGPKVAQLEEEFAAFCHRTYAIATNSCTAALELALRCLDIGPGDEVIVPAVTFCSTAHAVMAVGALPVFADVDPETACISRQSGFEVEDARTGAVIPVHFGGRPIEWDMGNLRGYVIGDCAHAAGSAQDDTPAGAFGTIACFSFHAVKNIACGDGGMIVTDNADIAARARRLSWLGIDKDTASRTTNTGYTWDYSIAEIGMKCHMNDITAAIALAQLARLSEMNTRRRQIAERYSAELVGVEIPPPLPENHTSSWHLYCIRHPVPARIAGELRRHHNIATGVHYRPLTYYPCYPPESRRGEYPGAEEWFRTCLSLPIFPDMTDEEQTRVIQAVNAAAEV